MATDTKKPTTATGALAGGLGRAMDERLGGAGFVRKSLNKVFPDHWSFMIGEIALYSFIILLLTGTYLTLFFKASSKEVLYHGSYVPLKGISMTEAYASTIDLSFDVRAGLLFRQMHHWAALMFVAAISVHLLRVFFTGAFRKPRELNWLIGVGLLNMALVEGFAGYSLPDDLLSGTGLRIAFSIMESVPVVGSYLSFFIFGGEFPGQDIISRLYAVHILLVPGALLGLISAHMAIIWHQKHTDFPGPGKTEHNVVGTRFFPTYSAKAGGFFFLVFGVTALLGGLAQINPIWLYGPYEAKNVSAGSQPDWYIGWLDGSSRLMPGWEIRAFGHTIPPIFWAAAVMPGIVFTILGAYPWLEQRFTGDRDHHNLLDRPRERPVRTSLGVAAITYYVVLMLSGGNDVFAKLFHISLGATTYAGRVGVIVGPFVAFYVSWKICHALTRREQLEDEHGTETGYIHMLPTGEFVEIHAPREQPKAKPRQVMNAEELPELPAAPSEVEAPAPAGGRTDPAFFTD